MSQSRTYVYKGPSASASCVAILAYIPLLAMTSADEFTFLCCTPSPPLTPSSTPDPSFATALDDDHNRDSAPKTRAKTHSKTNSRPQSHTGGFVVQVILVPITILTYAFT